MKLRRLLSAVTALLLVCSLPVSVFAAEYDLAAGSITVTATAEGQTVTHGDNAAVQDDAPVIIQSNSETSTTNTVTIKAEEDTTANVTLDGVNIGTGTSGGAAVEIKGNGNVVIELDGTNTVQSGRTHAGVEKNTIAATDTDSGTGNGNLTITDENETAGSLEATGGSLGAGIGGGNMGDGTNITITGSAEVNAQGGEYGGSGIGGGNVGSGSAITIEGSAKVDAQGGVSGAGIGGGNEGSGSNITITGSVEVTAQGGEYGGAGIGGGNVGSGSAITIEGSAKVDAQGGEGGAGIGGGDAVSVSNITITGSNITITGSAEVTATGGSLGAGIGGGSWSSGSDITISQNARVKAQGGDQGAGIGSGVGGSSGTNITITDSAKVDAQGGKGGAGIGGGAGGGSGSNIEISGSAEVTAQGGNNGSGIGGGYGGSGSDITVSQNAQVKAQGGNRLHPDNHRYYYSAGAAIGNGGKGQEGSYPTPGSEVPPNTNALNEGWIATYAPDTTDLDTTVPNSLTYKDNGQLTTSSNAVPVAKQEPTCTLDGHEAGFSVDGALVAVTIPKTGHSFTNYISDGNATYDADGTKTAKCDACDATDTIPAPGTRLPFYKVKGQDGAQLRCEEQKQDGVLTIEVDADCASLTGSFSGMKALKARGVDTIVFVTKGATSTFAVEDLLAQGASGDTYSLTHDGEKVTFTLGNGSDIGKILK